jgi:histidinol-phosphate aminotransferase
VQAGAQMIDVPLLQPDFALDVDGVLKAVNHKTKLVFLNSPNNPTGTIINRKDLQRLLDGLPPNVITVFDEVYFHFNEDPDFCTAQEFMERYNIIGINSLSKCFGLAGLRVGYMYSHPKIIDYLSGIQRPFQLSSLAIEGAAAALGDKAFMDKTVSLVNGEKKYLYTELDKLGVQYWRSQGNFIMIKPEMDEELFENKMIEYGVMVRPVGNFGASGCVRVTIGDRESNTAYIKALAQVIKE